MPVESVDKKFARMRSHLQPILPEMRYLLSEVKLVVQKDNTSLNPRDVVDKYLNSKDEKKIAKFFGLLIENNVQITMSGNLKPTSPKQLAVMFVRHYLWQYLRSDDELKTKYRTTVFANSFE